MTDHHTPDTADSRNTNLESDGQLHVVTGEGGLCPKQPPKNAIELLKQLDQMLWARFRNQTDPDASGK